MTTSQTGLRDVPALPRSLGRGRALACRSPLALCLPRRLGGVLPNRAASEMFRHVARCSGMSHHVALFSLYTKTAGSRGAALLRSLCFLLFNSCPMCADGARTRIPRAPSRDKCAFTCGKVRQCVPPWRDAPISRARPSVPKIRRSLQKLLWTHFWRLS